MGKDKCPKCKSDNFKMERAFYIDDDGSKILLDHWECVCNDCGWDFMKIYIASS